VIAAAHAIRLGHYQLDAVTGSNELLKGRDGELRRATKDEPHLPFPGSLQLAYLAQHKIALERTDAEDEEDPVQMVDFVLKRAGQ